MRRSGAVDGSVEVEIVESDDDGDGDGDDGRASGSNPHQRPAWEGDRARRQMLRRVGVGSGTAAGATTDPTPTRRSIWRRARSPSHAGRWWGLLPEARPPSPSPSPTDSTISTSTEWSTAPLRRI